MQVTQFDDPQYFLDRAQAYLVREESVNGLMLGIAIRLEMGLEQDAGEEAPLLLVVEDAGELIGTAVQTPPHKFVIYSHLPNPEPFITALTNFLLEKAYSVPGVLGPENVSRQFADKWYQCTGKPFHEGLRQGVYELREVREVTAVSGHFRSAKGEDIGILTKFMQGFSAVVGDRIETANALSYAQELTKHKMLFVWEDEKVVSMAASVRPTSNGMSVNLVYTPPEERRKGYATALVAALSQRLLDDGCQFCTLFTDMNNPTSNHIYQAIGYQKVAEFTEYFFVD
jgi:predicted GNAT family acetyltransferase